MALPVGRRLPAASGLHMCFKNQEPSLRFHRILSLLTGLTFKLPDMRTWCGVVYNYFDF